ncbi:HAMP domain-containing protein [Flaviaesturariibacter flavus]|uniref:histidine kinase n=1 Tax=Flaviaesturariibacter flavus TaxID=2502780 RepID=A0A4R1BC27_9BACT|nr:ATP-binding protein [Flaviaesturariibacter flavus]TCJ14527.1 HAMP domain-containing protein [Flaviaesturariibacter flavus]
MKIAQLIFFGFLFILLLFSLTTWMNYRQTERVKENTEFFQRSTTMVRQSNRFSRNILNIISSMRAYFLTGERSFIETFDTTAQENNAIIRELTSIADKTQLPALNRIDALNRRWSAEFGNILHTARQNAATGGDKALLVLYRSQFPAVVKGNVAEDLQDDIRNFINNEYRRREESRLQLAASIASTRRLSFTLTLVSIVIGLLIAGSVTRIIATRLQRMVRMADTIAAGNYKAQVEPGRDELGHLAVSLNHMARTLDTNISELKRKNAELDQFAHIVSHDLKSPLRGIGNVVSWIEEDHESELSPKVKEYLNLIKGRLERGESLIGGILSYARVGREEEAPEAVHVGELLHEIIGNQDLRSGAHVELSPALPLLYTERLPLFQVFSNLVGNAIKYNDKIQPRILVYHNEYAEHYEFFVQDNGPGIAPAYHRKVFGIFQTLGERKGVESTGVGLAIVKKILEARGEQIRLDSETGQGSVFSFTWKKKTHGKSN